MQVCERRVVHVGALVGIANLDVIVEIELPPAIYRDDLESVAIGRGKHGQVAPRHPVIAVPVFRVEPQVDSRFRLDFLEEFSLSPAGALLAGVCEPFSAVALD